MTVVSNDIHPMRFLRRFPEGQKIARDEARKFRGELLSSEAFERITNAVMQAYNRDLTRLPFEKRPENSDVAVATISTLAHIVTFLASGRNIFQIPNSLTNLLGNTSLTDIKLSDINLPFSSFYISFENDLNVGLPGETNFIDGVYVAKSNRRVSLYMTSKKLKNAKSSRAGWICNSEPHFFAPLEAIVEDETLDELLDRAISQNRIQLVPDYESVEELTRNGYAVGNPQLTGYERSAAFNKGAMPAAREVLALVGNVLCLLSTKPNIAIEWPTDAPKIRVSQAEKTVTAKRRRTALGDLAQHGFFPIKKIDLNVANVDLVQRPDVSTGGEVSTHWRRGHWRRQPFGEGLQQIRLLWIKPALVRRDKGEPDHGHLYKVKQEPRR